MKDELTRRRFLEAAAATVAAANVAPAAADEPIDSERQRLEAIVERYGSEIGDLRKAD